MSSPAPQHQPGWYPDPWKQAAQRWHDGSDWTAQTQASDAAPASAAPHLQPVPPGAVVQRTSGLATAALVLGLLGTGLIAVIVGVLALRQISRSGGELDGRGRAIAGIITGVVWGAFVFMVMLAVAIPTFLAQERSLITSQSAATVKQIVTSVESCAATNPSGSYEGCTGAELAQKEPALQSILERCGSAGGGCVELAPDTFGYAVEVQSADGSATFTEAHTSDGQVLRECDGPSCPTTA